MKTRGMCKQKKFIMYPGRIDMSFNSGISPGKQIIH